MIFLVNLDEIFAVVCMSFHKVVVCTRYISNLYLLFVLKILKYVLL